MVLYSRLDIGTEYIPIAGSSFGNTAVGASTNNVSTIAGTYHKAFQNITIGSIYAYLDNPGSEYSFGIYDSGLSLLGNTGSQRIPTGGEWYGLPLTSSVAITSGNYYWLCFWSSGTTTRYNTTKAGSISFTKTQTGFPSWPATISSTTAGSRVYSLYATGITGSSPTPREITNAKEINVSTGINREVDTININFDNYAGVYSGTFAIGNDINVYLAAGSPATTNQIFNGIITELNYNANDKNKEVLTIQGKNYMTRLTDVSATEVYDNISAGSIVRDLVDKYVTDISVSGVQEGQTIMHITFKQRPVLNCVKELAEQSNYDFLVDIDNDLKFFPVGGSTLGITLGSTNVGKARFNTDRDKMFNRIYVYGDRTLAGYTEYFTANGGSEYTLLDKPHNTTVITSGGTTVYKGGVFELTTELVSGVQYLVDYDQKKLIFVSGTSVGNNVPSSGTRMQCDYFRSVPIVKLAEDSNSIASYGVRQLNIVNNEIKDPNQAVEIARAQLTLYAQPMVQGTLNDVSFFVGNPGDTITVDFPKEGVNSQNYKIVKLDYNINKETLQTNKAMDVQLQDYNKDVSDILANALLDLKKQQARDVDTSDLITRNIFQTGSEGVRMANWRVMTRLIGSSFILSHPINGLLGSYANHHLGDYRAGSVIQVSGGYWT